MNIPHPGTSTSFVIVRVSSCCVFALSCFVCLLFIIAFCLFLSFSPLYLTVWWDSFSSFISVCSTSDFLLVKMAGDSGVAGNAHSSYDTWFQACSPSCRIFISCYLFVPLTIVCLYSCSIVLSCKRVCLVGNWYQNVKVFVGEVKHMCIVIFEN